jgi:hypothetical protein
MPCSKFTVKKQPFRQESADWHDYRKRLAVKSGILLKKAAVSAAARLRGRK